MNRVRLNEAYQFFEMIPKNFFYSNIIMPSHYGGGSSMRPKKMVMKEMKKLSDAEYYKEHSKHHSAGHIRAMKDLQKLGVDRDKAHMYVKKHMGK